MEDIADARGESHFAPEQSGDHRATRTSQGPSASHHSFDGEPAKFSGATLFHVNFTPRMIKIARVLVKVFGLEIVNVEKGGTKNHH